MKRFSWVKLFSLIGIVVGLVLFMLPAGSHADSLESALQSQLTQLQQQINQYQSTVSQLQQQKDTLQNQMDILNAQMGAAQLSINKINLAIQDLNNQIQAKQNEITKSEAQMNQEKLFLEETLQTIYENGQTSTLEMLLASNDFSDFFANIQSLQDLQSKLGDHLQKLISYKNQVEAQKQVLENNLQESQDLANIQAQQMTMLQSEQNQKTALLDQTQNNENTYNQYVQVTASKIREIQNQLYLLHGDSSSGSLSFDQALQYANFAAGQTGTPAALLLAILDRETGWGNNVGTGTWQTDMEPESLQQGASCIQQQAFLQITQQLGLNPDLVPVSRKPYYGWGGAMGPAQFLPCTWLGYAPRIAAITGDNTPSPWNVRDAFVAAGLYLANAGAGPSYNAQHTAAARYIGGGNWQSFVAQLYADQVMSLAQQFQQDINILNQAQANNG